MNNYVYQRTEFSPYELYAVGYYDPSGKWQTESAYQTKEEAAKQVNFLNGSQSDKLDRLQQENEQLREQLKQFERLQAPQEANEYDCCPRCSTYLKDENGVEGDYCPNCGQCIKWLLEQNYEVTI